MSVGAVVLAVLNALAAIPKIAEYVDRAVSAAMGWYVARQQAETLAEIADAAAFAARAVSQEDRYEAALKWTRALSRPRRSV